MGSPPDCCGCARSLRGKLTLAETRGLFFWGGGATLAWQSPRGTGLVSRSAWNTDFGPLLPLDSICLWTRVTFKQT